MLFKNLFLGLVGTATVGGIGYGIYSSSQSNGEEKKNTMDTENLKDQSDKAGDNSFIQEEENENPRVDNTDSNNTNNNPPSSPAAL